MKTKISDIDVMGRVSSGKDVRVGLNTLIERVISELGIGKSIGTATVELTRSKRLSEENDTDCDGVMSTEGKEVSERNISLELKS